MADVNNSINKQIHKLVKLAFGAYIHKLQHLYHIDRDIEQQLRINLILFAQIETLMFGILVGSSYED